jgi:hypothetical protein
LYIYTPMANYQYRGTIFGDEKIMTESELNSINNNFIKFFADMAQKKKKLNFSWLTRDLI